MKAIHYKPAMFFQRASNNAPNGDLKHFIAQQKAIYIHQLQSLSLTLRLATTADSERIMALRNERFEVPNSYSTHWLYHLLNYGSCILLETEDRELVGYKFEATYANDLTVSFTAGTAVKKEYSHLGLGKLLIGYSHLIAMNKGAKVNRGIIDTVNYPSVNNFINHFGGVFIDFERDFKDYGARLIYEIPLDCLTPTQRVIDFQRVEGFVKQQQRDRDYQLMNCDDLEKINFLYRKTDLKIIALLPKGFMGSSKEMYLAIPM